MFSITKDVLSLLCMVLWLEQMISKYLNTKKFAAYTQKVALVSGIVESECRYDIRATCLVPTTLS